MKKEQIFIGSVNICTKFEKEDLIVNSPSGNKYRFPMHNIEAKLFKTNIPLLKLKDDSYVCVDSIDGFKTYMELYNYLVSKGFSSSELVLCSCPSNENEIFVDVKSLTHYYDSENWKENTTIGNVKKDLMMDPRLSR